MKKRTLSLLMCLLLIVGVMPTTAFAAGGTTDTWAVKLNVSESDAYSYNGQKVLALGFGVQSDNLPVRKAASMVLAVDLEMFDLLKDNDDFSGVENAAGDLTVSLVQASTPIKKGVTIKPSESWNLNVYYAKSADEKFGYIQMIASQDAVDDKVVTAKDLATMYIGFKSGKSVSDLTKNSIRFINAAECALLNQGSAIEITNGKGNMQQAFLKDGSAGTLTITPEVAWNGITPSEPAKPAYTGAIAAPTVNSNAGGKVVLNAAELTPADTAAKIQYGYSNSASTAPTTWQDSTTFDSLTVGSTYYFYAKVVGTMEYTEKVSAATSVTVLDKELTNLEITTQPSTKTYTHGDTFKTDGMKVKATYNDGTFDADFKDYTVAYETSGKNYLCKDNTKVTLNAGGKSVEVTSLTVNAKELTVTGLTAVNREYKPGDTSVTLTGGTLNGVVSGETVTLGALPTGSITSADVGDGKDVSFAALTLSGADAGNYTLTQPTGIKVNITAKDISGAVITLGTQATYDGTEQSVVIDSVKVDGTPLTATTDYTITSDDKATDVGDIPLKIKGAGNYTGTASTTWSLQKATPNATDFNIPSSSAPVDYSGNSISVTPPSLTSPKTGAGDITVYYEGTSGTTYTKSTTAPTEVGTYNVTFDVAGGKNFNAANDLTYGTLTIQAKNVTVARPAENQTVVKNVGDFTPPTFGAVTGTLTYTYDGSTKTYDDIKAALAAKSAGYTATIDYSYAADGNYTGTITGTINVTVVDVVFEVNGAAADATNALDIKTDAVYGDTWADIVKIKDGVTITAKVGSDEDTAPEFKLEQTDRPNAGPGQTYNLIYNGTINGKTYTNVVVITGTVDVASREVTVSGITANNKEYDGNNTATVDTANATFSELVSGDTLNISVAGATFDDTAVGENKTVTLTLGTLSGADSANYTLAATGNQTVAKADITARTLTITDAAVSSKNYDGDTNADVTGVTFGNLVSGESLTIGTDYTVSGVFNSADAATDRTVTVTVTLKDTVKNYALPTATFDKPGVSINKIDHPTYGTTQTGNTNALRTTAGEKTYNLPYSDLAGVAYTVTAKTTANIVDDVPPTIAGNVLTYTSKVCATANATDTITIKIESTNYNDITLTLTVTATDKAPVTISGLTYTDKTYDGNAITPTGTLTVSDNKVPVNELEVLYTSTDGAGYSAATAPKDAGAYKVEYKVADSNPNYTGNVSYTFTISKKAATVAPKAVNITKGSAIPAFELVYTGLVSGDSLAPSAAPTFNCFEADGTTAVSTSTAAGTYTITWTNTGITFTGANNYDLTKTETATLTISNPSSSGGGGSYTPSYTVSVDKTANGTVTVTPKTAKKGDTVTLTATPDKDYELDTIKALDKDGKSLKLTDQGNGKYTFTMPAGKVTVKAAFAEVPQQIFADVPTDAFYYEAVKWAAEKKITDGVGNDLFAPNQPCSRAQIVTFLWRAAGSPDPKNMTTFTDVAQSSFYAKAVAWAVENGITKGTGDGKFSPDATCTRAQAVTFLYRASGAPAVSGNAAFSDVATNAYYAAAVKWAEKNGITGGIGGGLFGSDNNCTRAQIVTFLYRNYQSK